MCIRDRNWHSALSSSKHRWVPYRNTTTNPATTPEQLTALAAQAPPLNGRPLEPPRLHPVQWTSGQVFSTKQDPDRMREPWAPPEFLQDLSTKQPVVTAQELVVPGEGFACVLRNVLTPSQCAALITSVNLKGFTPALLNIGAGEQQLAPAYRDGYRVIVDCQQLADWLLPRVAPHLPEKISRFRFVGLNEVLRLDLDAG
eukprot:TRINITY_DN9737_c0_g2_i2.p1 TRINITY_DN9737_c0_g2~~TRINITY_DN9737_c0_g2_i2.p1  ORF type:complete len:200 (+),score=28.77 TRINITY_DN9737_c0_g2_i2:129-728(+)